MTAKKLTKLTKTSISRLQWDTLNYISRSEQAIRWNASETIHVLETRGFLDTDHQVFLVITDLTTRLFKDEHELGEAQRLATISEHHELM